MAKLEPVLVEFDEESGLFGGVVGISVGVRNQARQTPLLLQKRDPIHEIRERRFDPRPLAHEEHHYRQPCILFRALSFATNAVM